MARQRGDLTAECVTACLEIRKLVERRASRRQQHHRVVPGIRLCRGMGRRNRGVEAFASCARDFARQGRFQLLRGLADQKGVPDPIEIGLDRPQPAFLAASTGNPVTRSITGQRAGRGVGISGFAVIDVAGAVDDGHSCCR